MHRGAIFLCVLAIAALTGCKRSEPGQAVELVEAIGLHGTCKEDHAGRATEYIGVGYRFREKGGGKTVSSGFVRRPMPSFQELKQALEQPDQYQPPHSVYFIHGLGDTHPGRLTLHGVASRECDERPSDEAAAEESNCGYGSAATCELVVEKRSSSRAELEKWAYSRLRKR